MYYNPIAHHWPERISADGGAAKRKAAGLYSISSVAVNVFANRSATCLPKVTARRGHLLLGISKVWRLRRRYDRLSQLLRQRIVCDSNGQTIVPIV